MKHVVLWYPDQRNFCTVWIARVDFDINYPISCGTNVLHLSDSICVHVSRHKLNLIDITSMEQSKNGFVHCISGFSRHDMRRDISRISTLSSAMTKVVVSKVLKHW